MIYFILIKYAMPHIDESKSGSAWQLSDAGRASCVPLAKALSKYQPDIMITSKEPKAIETGKIATDYLQITCESAPDLYEHDRTNFAFIHDKDLWHKTVQTFLINLTISSDCTDPSCR